MRTRIWNTTVLWNLKFEFWNLKFEFWNLKFEFWIWNLNLKFEFEIRIWNLNLKFKFEIWNLKFEIWIWNLNLKFEIQILNHSPSRIRICCGKSTRFEIRIWVGFGEDNLVRILLEFWIQIPTNKGRNFEDNPQGNFGFCGWDSRVNSSFNPSWIWILSFPEKWPKLGSISPRKFG